MLEANEKKASWNLARTMPVSNRQSFPAFTFIFILSRCKSHLPKVGQRFLSRGECKSII